MRGRSLRQGEAGASDHVPAWVVLDGRQRRKHGGSGRVAPEGLAPHQPELLRVLAAALPLRRTSVHIEAREVSLTQALLELHCIACHQRLR